MKLTSITDLTAIRRDSTLGNRIFVGDTMVHGDTGWRDVTSVYLKTAASTGNVLDLSGGGRIFIRRQNQDLILRFMGPIATSRNWSNLFQLTSSWRPAVGTESTYRGEVYVWTSGSWIQLRGTPEGPWIPADRTHDFRMAASSVWVASMVGTPT